MKKKLLVGLLILSLVAVPLFTIACEEEEVTPPPAQQEEEEEEEEAPPAETIEIKFATWHSEVDFAVEHLEWFAEEINKRTDGQVEMTLFLAGALGGMTELAENLQNGVTDMAIFNPAFTPGLIPACELMAVPLTVPNTHVMSLIGWHLISEGYISLEGVKLLEIGSFENQVLCTTNRKVANLEDFGGLVLGTPGTYGDLLSQLNASEMMLPPPDIYTSVERGVVDGGCFGWALPYTYQMESILGYINTDSFGCDPWLIGINQDFWDSLPSDIQVIMLDLCREANSKFCALVNTQNQKDADYFAAQPGVELYTFNPGVYEELRELARPLTENMAAQLDAQGFPGTEVLEIIRTDLEALGY